MIQRDSTVQNKIQNIQSFVFKSIEFVHFLNRNNRSLILNMKINEKRRIYFFI